MTLCAVTDDISNHFELSLSLAEAHGVGTIEMRTVFGHRFPFFEDTEFALIQSALAQHELKVAAVSLGSYRIGADRTPWAYIKQLPYAKVLSMTAQLGAHDLVVFAPDIFLPENERRDYVESTRKFALRADRRGFAVCVRNAAASAANSAGEILAAMPVIGAKWIGWDPAAAACMGKLDLHADIERLFPYLRNVYIRDFKRRPGGVELVPPGSGEMDIPLLLRELHRLGYRGRITADTGCWETEEQFARTAAYLRALRERLSASI